MRQVKKQRTSEMFDKKIQFKNRGAFLSDTLRRQFTCFYLPRKNYFISFVDCWGGRKFVQKMPKRLLKKSKFQRYRANTMLKGWKLFAKNLFFAYQRNLINITRQKYFLEALFWCFINRIRSSYHLKFNSMYESSSYLHDTRSS
jgi:hypothetical protein